MFSQKSFSFSADCKTLEQSIKKVVSVAGPQALYFIGIYKKTVCVFGLGTDTFAMLAVPNAETTSAAGTFGFAIDVLPGLIKNRSVMEFKFNGTECLFKQVKGKYSGKINTVGVTEDHSTQLLAKVTEKVPASAAISADVLSHIKAGLAATSVQDVYQNTTLMSYVTLTEDGKLVVSSFDAQHFGIARSKIEGGGAKFRAALPASHFSLVDQVANGSDTKFSIVASGLRASGKGFIVGLPATQAEDKHYSMVPEFVKALPKSLYECTCSTEKLASIADNLYTLYSANSSFVVTTKDNVLTIALSTASGSASDAVQVKTNSKKPVTFSVDPRLLMDVLSLAKPCKDATFRLTDKVFAITGTIGDASVFIACSRIE